jgi:predicted Zn-dependent peptidase
MNYKNVFKKFTILALFLFAAVSFSFAQPPQKTPRQEKLLNGMNLLVWNEPSAPKATVKLRIHSGSAFDPLGKEGTMALLADILFPTGAAREFFTEDLGGSLDVASNYDYIQISATADSDQFLTMLETIASAVTNPQIDKETTERVRAARIESVKALEKNPSYLADQAVAKRLFGDFPYGRAQAGTSQSLAKIDFADVLLAKQKFLTADNATLAVSGNVKPDLVSRAARRFFGAWTQSDKKIPATFRQPDAPDTKFFLIKTEIDKASELRFAFRGFSRADKDFYAAQILTAVLQDRLKKKDGDKVVLEQKSYFLPGLMVVRFSDWDSSSLKIAGENISLAQNFSEYVQSLLAANLTAEEFQAAKERVAQQYNRQNPIDRWLDADTFKSAPPKAEQMQGVTLADAQRVLERLRPEAVVRTYLYKTSS